MKRRIELIKIMASEAQKEINPVAELKQRGNTKQAFQLIRSTIDDINYLARIAGYVEQGLIGILAGFLRDGV